jgi:hypothetical protein
MTTITRVNTAAPGPSTLQLALVFAALFTAYQLPEGLGQHVLHSVPVQAVLLVMFFPIAWVCGRALGFRRFDAWFMQLTPGWGTLLAASFGMALLAKGAALGLGAGAGVYRIESLGLNAAGVAHVELVRPAAAPLVSILAHLALLAIVVLVARSKRAASGAIR